MLFLFQSLETRLSNQSHMTTMIKTILQGSKASNYIKTYLKCVLKVSNTDIETIYESGGTACATKSRRHNIQTPSEYIRDMLQKPGCYEDLQGRTSR